MIPERGPQTMFKIAKLRNIKMQNCTIANIANMQNCKQYERAKLQKCKIVKITKMRNYYLISI